MKKNEIDQLLNILLIFSIFLSVTGLLTDISNTQKYGGVDLRNRVVGARLLTRDLDPYHFKWQKGDSHLLLDPRDNPNWNVNRVTVPPSVLIIHTTFSWLSYKTQRFFWLAIQWLLLLGSIFFFANSSNSEFKTKLIWVCGLFFVGNSFYWRLHVERGQIYILYTFLIALAFWIYDKSKWKNVFLSGFIIGLTSLLRPPVILINLPFLLKKQFKFILGSITGVLLSFLTTLLIIPVTTWKQYFNAMRIHGTIHITSSSLIERYPYENVEGITNLWAVPNIPIIDTSIQGLLLDLFGLVVPSRILWVSLVFVLMVGIILFTKIKNINHKMLFLVGSIMIFVSEFFIPAARYSYNNVIWVIILSLLLLNFDRLRMTNTK